MTAERDQLHIAPRCHPLAPLRARLDRAGSLVLTCARCGALVDSWGTSAATLAILATIAAGVLVAVIVLVLAFYPW